MTGFVDGNRITLLVSGGEFFPALIEAFDGAVREIHLETYIFEADATGRSIAAALMRAAGRGVSVNVMVDGYGSQDLDPALVREMRAAGVRFLVYRRQISPWTLRRTRLRRLHRKISLVDGRVAFVGGINIIDDLDVPGVKVPRFDYAVRVEGPLLARIQTEVKRLWSRVRAVSLRARRAEPGDVAPTADRRGNQRAAFLVRDNIAHRGDIERAYLDAIGQARSEILIANAYFFPGRRFRLALIQAAARGVRVILLLQGRVEYLLQHYATRALYGPFLDAGIEIHEYQKSYLHAKVAVIDGRWSTVGSSNIDPFSLLLAREANVMIDDEGFARHLRESLLGSLTAGAARLQRERWADEPWTTRAATWGCYQLARFITGVFAYGRAEEFT